MYAELQFDYTACSDRGIITIRTSTELKGLPPVPLVMLVV